MFILIFSLDNHQNGRQWPWVKYLLLQFMSKLRNSTLIYTHKKVPRTSTNELISRIEASCKSMQKKFQKYLESKGS